MNDVTALGGKGYQGFCDDSTRVIVLKSVTIGKGVLKNIKYCVTSFMDDPITLSNTNEIKKHFLFSANKFLPALSFLYRRLSTINEITN